MNPKLAGSIAFVLVLLFAMDVFAQSPVSIEFFYLVPTCDTCDPSATAKYIAAQNLIDKIQSDYDDQVLIERVNRTSAEGRERYVEYGLTEAQAVVVNRKIKLQGDQLTEDNLKMYIDAYLRGDDPASDTFRPVTALFAFSTGLISGLSPCLMAMLGFILSYTSGTVSSFKSGMFRVSIFGIGFVSALLLIGALFAAVLMLVPSFTITMTWAASVLIIIVGSNLVGLLPVPSVLSSLSRKLGSRGRVELAQRYRATTIGLFSLGFIFYFVSICTAPLSFTVLPTLSAPSNIYLLPLFGIGAIIPFLAVGLVAGGSPALAKKIGQQHRLKIRALSGAILLAYSVWLIVFNLLSSKMALAYSLATGFSSSLLAVLAFILLYSASTSRSLKEPLGKSLVFALGIVTGNAVLSVSLMTAGVDFYLDLFANLQTVTTVIAAIMILAGLFVSGVLDSLLGSAQLKERLVGKYSLTLLALYFLGILSFLTTVRVFPLSRFITEGTAIDLNLLLAFNLVLLAPFLAVGIISGALHKLARSAYEKHRFKIHALSGLVLLLYAVWLLWQTIQ